MNTDSNINPLPSTQDPTEATLNNTNNSDSHAQTTQTGSEQIPQTAPSEQENMSNIADTPATAQEQIFENSTRQVEESKIADSQNTEVRSFMSFNCGRGRNGVIAEERSEGHEENNEDQEEDQESHQDDAMTFRTLGSQNFIQFNHLSQDRSVITNSQVSLFKQMSQAENEGHGFWDENGFDSRQSSQFFDRSQSIRVQRGPPELLHSDSNFMFGPRYKTKAYDPTVSPMKKSARKSLPKFGRDIMQSYDDDDNSEQRYDQEEKDRRKSMSRLSLSNNKQRKRFTRESTLEEVHEVVNPFINEVSFNGNNNPLSSQNDDISDGNPQPSSQQEIVPALNFRRLDSVLNEETQLQSQDMKVSRMFEPVIPQGEEDCETIMEPSCGLPGTTAEVNNWSVLTEPPGDYSLMTTENFMKSSNIEMNGKASESKKSVSYSYRSPLSSKVKSIQGGNTAKKEEDCLQSDQKSSTYVSRTKSDKENIDPSQEAVMEIECPRGSDKTSQGHSSQVAYEKGIEEEEEYIDRNKSKSGTMSVEKNPMNNEEMKENNSTTPSKQSPTADNHENQQQQQPLFEGELSTTKKLSYMERKLRAIEAENYKMMGAFDFKKSYSKIEKEKMEREQEQKTQNLFQSCQKTPKQAEENQSSFMTDTKKHFSKIQLEKMASKELSNNSERVPLQSIQSEADRDALYSQDSLTGGMHKSVIFTPQANEKKRKYDAISTSDECPGSAFEGGHTSLKRVKITDENHVETFEEMLAKSKKKIPRIQLEKELQKEKDKAQKEQELKELQAHLKDTVFKVEIPIMFKKEENSGLNSQDSLSDSRKGYHNRRQSNGVM